MKLLFLISTIFCLSFYPGFSQGDGSKKVIVLDPRFPFGQNSSDSNYALAILQKVKEQLVKNGYDVYLTAENSERLSLDERLYVTNSKNADLYFALSFHNINLTKYGRKQKDLTENYRLIPIVSKRPDTSDFVNAKKISTAIKSGIAERRTVVPKIFTHAFVYDIPHYGAILSIGYKPETDFYKQLDKTAYQQMLATTLATTIVKLL